ncbi:MAG: peptide chain release factor N(5)-glutamine methyltransferase [Clostridia bacterium]|nr:peptide chain release factor N(5)-glutamine methyltransferase [Clostridia bacterium]MBQ9998054.1 peptide chain release factor N(5)-glutamine methyltransferase [Clostridia bacterium]
MRINDLLIQGTELLKQNGIGTCVLDAQLLLAHYLKVDKLFVINNRKTDLAEWEGYFDLLSRRAKHEPMAYILGKKEFMSLDFYVDKNVLIPRPDTEILVEYAIGVIKNKRVNVLDIGTGSGCIGISVVANCKHCKVTGIDISDSTLEIAQNNAESNKAGKRFKTIKCDILNEMPEGKFNVILSNPPYIPPKVIETLEDDVKKYEPYHALNGGDDGLVFYRKISETGKKLLTDKYFIALEVGHDQSEQVMEILKNDGYENITAIKDLAGIERVVIARSSRF